MQAPNLKDLTLDGLMKILPADLIDSLYEKALETRLKLTYKEYLLENDPESSITKFLQDRMILADHHCSKDFSGLLFQEFDDCYVNYYDYCEECGLDSVKPDVFSKEMADRGFQLSDMDLQGRRDRIGFVGVHCLYMDREEWCVKEEKDSN